jgi:hypothetical protein
MTPDPGIPATTAKLAASAKRLLRRLRKHHPDREIPAGASSNGSNGHSAPMAAPMGDGLRFTLTAGPQWYGESRRYGEDLAERTGFARSTIQAAKSYRGASTARSQIRPREPGTTAAWEGQRVGVVPADVEADRQRRLALPRPLSCIIFGDPIPGSGQSALEQRRAMSDGAAPSLTVC